MHVILVESVSPCCRVNSIVNVGSTASFPCCRAAENDSILQFHYSPNNDREEYTLIYNGQKLDKQFANKFEINEDEFTKLPTLRLLNATLNDSGEYLCQYRRPGTESNKKTHLSVLRTFSKI